MTNIEGGEFIGPKLLSERDTMERVRDLHRKDLAYRQYWENADLTNEQGSDWENVHNELAAFAVTSIPRIESGEFKLLGISSHPDSPYFHIEFPGGHRAVRVTIESAQKLNPNIKEELVKYQPHLKA